MDITEALKIADNLVFASRNKHLSDLERAIIEGVCEGKKYSQIANDNYCEQSHVNDVAADLWKAISNAVGEQVKKTNFRSTIERYRSENSASVGQVSFNVCSQITLNNHQYHEDRQIDRTNTPQYLKTIPDLIPIYGRTQELDSLKNWILTEQCRSIVVYGTSGIGKTTLARQLLEDLKGEFDEIVWQSLGCQRSLVEFIDRNLIASL
ncbi:ATP-binding protein, partial [Chamaesiphon sp. OTE_75_metabat_556]|uniref:ATP-binding protein n=1 Tax=Chamaesiphon sp. OTE_75_metabat_556 TaxID=2964692 RepID=UPI00286ABF8C